MQIFVPNHTHQIDAQSQSKSISPWRPFTTFLFRPFFRNFHIHLTPIQYKAFQYNISQLHQLILGLTTAKPKGKDLFAAHLDAHNTVLAPFLRVQLGLLYAQDTKRCHNIHHMHKKCAEVSLPQMI